MTVAESHDEVAGVVDDRVGDAEVRIQQMRIEQALSARGVELGWMRGALTQPHRRQRHITLTAHMKSNPGHAIRGLDGEGHAEKNGTSAARSDVIGSRRRSCSDAVAITVSVVDQGAASAALAVRISARPAAVGCPLASQANATLPRSDGRVIVSA